MDAEKVTVQQLAEALDRWAPWAGAESWDNVCLLYTSSARLLYRLAWHAAGCF